MTRSSARASGFVLALVALAVGEREAHADGDLFMTGHAAYAIGGAAGAYGGFRQGVDVAGGAGLGHCSGGNDAMGGGCEGAAAHAWLMTGFGAYPTYVGLGGGYASRGVVGVTVSAGPALRVDPSLGVGGELRGAISIFGVQAGARVIAVGMHGFDLQPTITLGYGFD